MDNIHAESRIREHVDAFNARDLKRLMAGFTDDATWVTGSTTVSGRADLTEFFGKALTGLLPHLAIKNVIADGDRAAAELYETFHRDGTARDAHIAGFYTLTDGRISRAKIYREGSADT